MPVPAQEAYRAWAESYDTALNPLLALEERLLAGILGSVASGRVIDAGCGTGRWMARLARQGAAVIGFDSSGPMLAIGARKPAARGRLALADLRSIPIASGAADLTICSFVLSYCSAPERAVGELARITKRGGRVIVADLHPEAAAAGWNRSFRANGHVYEIEHFAHPLSRIRCAAGAAGLLLKTELQSAFDSPEQPIFAAAGKQRAFAAIAAIPAIWIGQWSRE